MMYSIAGRRGLTIRRMMVVSVAASMGVVVRSFPFSACNNNNNNVQNGILLSNNDNLLLQGQRTLFSSTTTTTTALNMVRTRGLEKTVEGATPKEGGMTLYLKAGPDGSSVGDCPFAHAVRLVLEEKGLDYTVQPTTPESKPDWLIDHYDGKMPALRHRKECYVESSVIMEYLDFFFTSPEMKPKDRNAAEAVLEGFFPAVAQYLKDTTDDEEKLTELRSKLDALEHHLTPSNDDNKVPFVGGGYDNMSLLDCRLIPQLYHLVTASREYHNGIPNLQEDYPNIWKYYLKVTARPSFETTVYPEETVLWGWGNARSSN
eukprot:scaffold6226_cov118-Cylindrotheca_fusiformis.AAC.5